MATNRDPYIDTLLGYRPRTAWDTMTPEQRSLVGPNPIQDPLGAGTREALGLPSWRSQPIDYITPDQKTQVLSALGRTAMTSAGAIGDFLDKTFGARAFRGVTGAALKSLDPYGGHQGSWREALSVIPFSDTLGITDPNEKVGAREVFNIKNDPNSYMDNILSFGLDMAMDPTLFVGGFLKGGLTAGGKALQAAGGLRDVDWALKSAAKAAGKGAGKLSLRGSTTLDDALKAIADPALSDSLRASISRTAGNANVMDEWLRAPVGKSLDIGVPFSDRMRTGFNLPFVDTIRDKAFDRISGNPVVRGVLNQLYAPVSEMKTKIGQAIGRQFSHLQSKVPEWAEKIIGESARLREAGEWTPQGAQKLYREIEGFTTPATRTALHDVAQSVQDLTRAEREALGFGVEHADKYASKYAPRYTYEPKDMVHGPQQGQVPVLDGRGNTASRSPALKNIRGGTASVMEIMMDPAVVTASKGKGWSKNLDNALAKYHNLIPDHVADQMLMDDLKSIIHRTPKDVLERGFYMHPAESLYKYLGKHSDKVNTVRSQIDMMAQGFQDVASGAYKGETAAFEDLFKYGPRGDTWRKKAFAAPHYELVDDMVRIKNQGIKNPMRGGMYVEFIKKYGTPYQKQVLEGASKFWDQAVSATDQGMLDAANQAAETLFKEVGENVRVPKKVMADVTHWDDVISGGRQIHELSTWYDKFTNLFKAGVLTWPARYVRDLFSGQAQNIMLNQWSLGAASDALKFVEKGSIPGAKQYLTHLDKQVVDAMSDKEAMDALRAHLAATGILGPEHAALSQVGTVKPQSTLDAILNDMPGSNRHGTARAVFDELKGLGTKEGANPLNIRGVRGDETKFAMARAGDVIGKTTDNLNRLVPYLTLKKRGVGTNEALRRVMSSQVDYSTKSLTKTEQLIASRAFPFWRYTSKMMPFVFEEVLNRPGGAMAQAIKLSGKVGGGGDGEFVPEHLRQNMALPLSGFLGSKDPERQRFLTGLGMMHEDPLSMYQPGANMSATLQNFLKDVGGRLNPILKAPTELAYRRQLFSGRDLLDLDSNIGRLASNAGKMVGLDVGDTPPRVPLALDVLASNSPAARLLTSLRTATDPAKGLGARALNLLTGARVTDVNLEKARSASINEAVEEVLRGKPGVRSLRPHLYVREEDRQNLDPMDLLLLDLYRQQLSEAKRRSMADKKSMDINQLLNQARNTSELETDRRLF